MNRSKHLKLLLLIFLTASIVLSGCKKEEETQPTPDPNNEVVLSDATRILDALTLATLTHVDTSNYTLTFNGSTAQLQALTIGNIVVSGIHEKAPYGFMRKVVSISENAGNYTITTSPATLKEVLLQGSIRGVHEKLGYKHIKSIKLDEGVTLNQPKASDLLGFDLSFEKSLGQNAVASGTLYFDMGFYFDLDVSLIANVDYFKAAIYADQRASIGVWADGSWSGSTFKVAEVEFTPWTIMVGPLPLVFVPQAALILDAKSGQADASFETYAMEEFSRELGIKYDGDDWSLINEWNPAPNADIVWPSLEGNASFEIECGPRASLKLYGAAGPYFDLTAYSTLDAHASNDGYNLDFIIGLEANAGVEISAFGFELLDYSKQLFRNEIKRLHLENQPLPVGLRITKPADGATVLQGSSVAIEATLGGQAVDGVKFFLDGTLLGTDLTSPYEYPWQVTQAPGNHILKAEAQVDGQTLTHQINIKIGTPTWLTVDMGNAVNQGEELTSIFFVTADEGWITGKSTGFGNDRYGFVLHTTNGGNTWTRQATFASAGNFANGYAYDILMLGPNHGFITGQFDGGIMQTGNGSSWIHRTDFISPDSSNGWLPWPLGVTASKSGAVILYDNITMNISIDGGVHWYDENNVNFQSQITGQIKQIAFGSGSNGYLCAYDEVEGSQVFKTTDNGFNWNEMNISQFSGQFEVRSVAAFGTDYCWLAGIDREGEEQAMILFTTNGGASWQKATTPESVVGHNLKTIWFNDENHGYAAGGLVNMTGITTGILETNDGGQTWTEVAVNNPGLYSYINKMYFFGASNGFAIGYTEQSGGTSSENLPLLIKYTISK